MSNGIYTNNEEYYQAVSGLVSSHWDKSFFGVASISIGDNILKVDNRSSKLYNSAEIQNGEPMLPLEALPELGVQVSSDSKGAILRMKNRSVEVVYGEASMKMGDNKKELRAVASLKNGKPVLPASVIADQGLGFEVTYEESAKTIIITNRYQTARIVVKFMPGTTAPENIKATQIIAGPDGQYVYQFDTPDEAKAACELLSASPGVIYAEPDLFVTLSNESVYENDRFELLDKLDTLELRELLNKLELRELLGGLAKFRVAFSHLSWGAERIGADAYMRRLIVEGKQNTSVKVAVLDTGLDTAHPFLKQRNIPGYNFVNTTSPPMDDHYDPPNGRGHGTHVSGTIVDVTIALPNVKIMPVKVLNAAGSGSGLNIANGVRWAAEHSAKVINMSLGGYGCTQVIDDAVAYAISNGVTVIVAAGNGINGVGVDASGFCPAHIGTVITVSAVDEVDKPASFTNYGSCVDVAAPGVAITSTLPANQVPGVIFGSMSGTSMVSPHVAGAVAMLLCDANSSLLTPERTQALIRSCVDPIVTNNSRYYGTGILNLKKLVLPTGITVTPSTTALSLLTLIGSPISKVQLTATVSPSNATDKSVTWSSNNTTVATVSSNGLILPVAVGSAIITAETINGLKAACYVTVTGLPSIRERITVTPSTAALNVGEKQKLTATIAPTPSNMPKISWSSSNPAVATVSISSGLALIGTSVAELTAVASGVSIITVETSSGLKATCDVTVNRSIPVRERLTLTLSKVALVVGETQKLTATITPTPATMPDIKWFSNNPRVATVDLDIMRPIFGSSNAVIAAVDLGDAVITVETSSGLKATCDVTVEKKLREVPIGKSVISDT